MDISLDLIRAYEDGYEDGKINATQWISINDRLPDVDGRYLTCDHKGNIHIFYHYVGSKYPFSISEYDTRFYMVTHWMYLPEPPKGEW